MPGNQNGDSYNFQSLQEEAIRRAREMQARTHFSSGDSSAPVNAHTSPPQEAPPHSEQLPIHEAPPPAPPAPASGAEEPSVDSGFGFLDSLLKDHERTLIWVLLLILLEEKADTALIFALMYLAT
jgi:hypothetical protein